MAKRGRPTKSGERYKCGKRTPTAIQEDMRKVALEARMRIFGISKDLAGNPDMGSPLGRLVHWKVISQAQADAGYSFAQVMREFLAAADLPKPTAGSTNPEPRSRGGVNLEPYDPPKEAAAQSRARRYMEALREVDRTDPFSGPTATSVVWDVCINETDRRSIAEIGALRVGLNAVHRVWYGRKAA
jgi:hypothetical protein